MGSAREGRRQRDGAVRRCDPADGRREDGAVTRSELRNTHRAREGIFAARHGASHPEDGGRARPLFLPWLGHTLVGTTDNPAKIEENPRASGEDIDYILRQLRKYFAVKVERSDILAAWSGLRPLVYDPKAADTAHISRDHTVNVSPSGLITITGGKWTTYRKMASDTVDHAIKLAALSPRRAASTRTIPLAGAEGYTPEMAERLAAAYGIPADSARHLADSYGDRAYRVCDIARRGYAERLVPGHPYLEAEVIYGVQEEEARSAVDILARRTRLAFLDVKAALHALPRVVTLMGDTLGWDAARREREIRDAGVSFRI